MHSSWANLTRVRVRRPLWVRRGAFSPGFTLGESSWWPSLAVAAMEQETIGPVFRMYGLHKSRWQSFMSDIVLRA